MVRHIVCWDYKEGFSDEQNRENALKIKQGLETLAGKLDGVVELAVYIHALPTGDKPVALNSLFANADALAAYQAHPEHQQMLTLIRSVMTGRVCADFEE